LPYPIVFFFYRIAYYLVRIAFFFYYRISFEGRENVPKGTAVIFASNHRSYLDPVLVAMAAPHPFNFIAKEPLFRNPVFGGFIPVRNRIIPLKSSEMVDTNNIIQ